MIRLSLLNDVEITQRTFRDALRTLSNVWMERFAKTLNNQKSIIISTKCSILYVWKGSDYVNDIIIEAWSCRNLKHCTKNEVFREGFLQLVWPYPQEKLDMVTFTKEIFNGKLHFFAVNMCYFIFCDCDLVTKLFCNLGITELLNELLKQIRIV